MSNYRRDNTAGGTWFLTAVTFNRRPILCDESTRHALRESIERVRSRYPFKIDAWVLLPDHFHTIWTLPDGDSNYPLRMRLLKTWVTKSCKDVLHHEKWNSSSRTSKQESTVWQRRYWEHRIRDDSDFKIHMNYIHFNPVKHQLCASPIEWPYSTLHRLIQQNKYPENWGSEEEPAFPAALKFGET